MDTQTTKLAILIPTLEARQRYLDRLMECLKPQLRGDTQILIEKDQGQETTGVKRNRLVERASKIGAEYVVHIDDDDLVSDDYIGSVSTALQARPDCVGYWIQRYRDGAEVDLACHTMRNANYATVRWDKGNLHQRTINHVNPVKTSIAASVPFPDKTIGEDTEYANRLYAKLTSEVFIDRVLYHYFERTHKHDGYSLLVKYPSRQRPEIFKRRVKEWTDNAASSERLHWLCSFDTDDQTMNNDSIRNFCDQRGIEYYFETGSTKIEAINRDIGRTTFKWDALIACADDNIAERNWDLSCDRELVSPDYAVWYFDTRQKRINTIPLIGRNAFYEILGGNIYDPRFKSLWADNWQTDLLQKAGRLKFVLDSPFIHKWKTEVGDDELLQRNEAQELHTFDKNLYLELGGQIVPFAGQ